MIKCKGIEITDYMKIYKYMIRESKSVWFVLNALLSENPNNYNKMPTLKKGFSHLLLSLSSYILIKQWQYTFFVCCLYIIHQTYLILSISVV